MFMNKKNDIQNDSSPESTDLLVAKLALFGATLTTIGDGIAA